MGTLSPIIAPAFYVGAVANKIGSEAGGIVINEDSADVDFRVESNGNANMLFVDGGADAVCIGTGTAQSGAALTVAGNVAIGATAPQQLLHIYENSANAKGLRVQNSEGYADFTADGATGILAVGGTTALTLTNTPSATFAGNTTVGSSTAYVQATTAGVINQVRQAQVVDHYMYCYSDTATHRPRLFAYKTRGTAATPTKTLNGNNLFDIAVGGFDTALALGATIAFIADADWGDSATDAPTRIEISTSANGSDTPALAMTIGSAQNVTFAGNVEYSVTNAITASTTQSQGQGALTKTINRVTVCANANDVVTLPNNVAGRVCIIINRGAQTLQIFPASGDSINTGSVDASTTLAAAAKVEFVAIDGTIWESV